MALSAAGLVWELAGRPDCGKPTVAYDGSCYVCGEACHGGVAVRAKVALGINFDHTRAGDRTSTRVCAACMWALSGKPPLSLRMWSGVASPDRVLPPNDLQRARAFVKIAAPAVSTIQALDGIASFERLVTDLGESVDILGFGDELSDMIVKVSAAIARATDETRTAAERRIEWPDVVGMVDVVERVVERIVGGLEAVGGEVDETLAGLLGMVVSVLDQSVAVVRMLACSPHVHLTNRADMTAVAALLTDPPEGPWAAWIAISGQKHVLPYTTINHGVGPWAVQVEDSTATSTPAGFATVLARVCRLRGAGFPEAAILAGDPGTWITTTERLDVWRTHGEPLATMADSPTLRLACLIPTKGTLDELTARYGHHAPTRSGPDPARS